MTPDREVRCVSATPRCVVPGSCAAIADAFGVTSFAYSIGNDYEFRCIHFRCGVSAKPLHIGRTIIRQTVARKGLPKPFADRQL